VSALVVITDCDLPSAEMARALLEDAGLRVLQASCRTPDEVIEAALEADALIVQWASITSAVVESLDRCRVISRMGVGYDMIDVDAATARGIAVANTPDYCVEEVASHTIGLILAGVRQLVALDRWTREGRWQIVPDGPLPRRPSETTVGIAGFGRIGSRVAEFASALGFRVVVADPFVHAERIVQARCIPVELGELVTEADILSLHVPLVDATRHLIDRSALRAMKPGAFLVNTCRGGLVDEQALVEALEAGLLGGAALDVFESEPLPAESPLRHAPRVILGPHAAWYSASALSELPLRAARHVVDFFAGAPVTAVVNPGYRSVADGAV
jgi:D-3-phosphoglycerate dehydrogenase / 2-oxoglutarate reductase